MFDTAPHRNIHNRLSRHALSRHHTFHARSRSVERPICHFSRITRSQYHEIRRFGRIERSERTG